VVSHFLQPVGHFRQVVGRFLPPVGAFRLAAAFPDTPGALSEHRRGRRLSGRR